MAVIKQLVGKAMVSGTCEPEFNRVAEQFIQNFAERGEVGASVCVRIGEQTVVDLWGGFSDPETQAPWLEDSVSVVFSCTKAATALCAHLLVDRGLLNLQAPVSQYWPEFAQAGKQDATVAMMLNHSVGLPAFRDPIKPDGYNDWDYMVQRLELEEPFWEPGTRNGYHMISFGWTVGELVRRVSGKSLGQFFRDEIATPLGLDFWIGLPEEVEPRVVPMISAVPDFEPPLSDFTQALMNNPQSISHLALLNSGGFSANSPAVHAAEIGGAGGISNARSLSKMYVPLANGGRAFGRDYLKPSTITRMSRISTATLQDATLLIPTCFALGFMKSMDNRDYKPGNKESFIVSDRAFGHVGAGGSAGFADPESNMAFGYTMNAMSSGVMLNERGQSLVDAAYLSAGYSDCDGGVWVK